MAVMRDTATPTRSTCRAIGTDWLSISAGSRLSDWQRSCGIDLWARGSAVAQSERHAIGAHVMAVLALRYEDRNGE